MSGFFPVVEAKSGAVEQSLPLCREVKWDFDANRPVFRRGTPETVEGGDAVAVWAWLALHTPRFRHEIYTRAYGSELESLIGQPYTEAVKRSEAARYVRETLAVNPYIRSVDQVEVSFSGGTLSLVCGLNTLYGKREVNAVV